MNWNRSERTICTAGGSELTKRPSRAGSALRLASWVLGTASALVPFASAQGLGPAGTLKPSSRGQLALGPFTCPDGSSPLTQVKAGCFPVDCVSLSPLDWGTGSVPSQAISVDKFDPGLGTLQQVDFIFRSRFVGSMCADNPVASCGAAQLSAAFLGTALPSPLNSPPLTSVNLIQVNGSKELTPLGFLLGATDGFDDCATPGVTQGPPSIGNCAPGEDHFVGSYDELFAGNVTTLTGADLLPWIGPAGSQVTFDSTASGLVSGSFSPNLNIVLSAQARVWVDVTYHYCPNVPPVCGPDDQVQTDEAMPVEIDVLANDLDVDGTIDCTTLRIAAGQGPTNGTAIVSPGCASAGSCPDPACRIVYTPNPGFCGVDTFQYEVQDDDGAWMQSCPVTVTVLPVNEPPVAVDDSASTPEGIPVLVDVCANDSDPDALTGCGDDIDCTIPGAANKPLTIIDQPDCGGSAAVIYHQGVWKIRVNPPPGFCGQCTLTYTIKDTGNPRLESNVATVTVDVTPVNDPPVAGDDSATTDEGVPVLIPICKNDSDPDDATGCGAGIDCTTPGAPNNPFTLVSPPDCGGNVSFIFNAGTWKARFDPPAGFCGTCQFTYTIEDTGTPPLVSNVATVTVDVLPVNEPPVAVDDAVSTDEGVPVTVFVCANDSDPDDVTGCGEGIDCFGPNPLTVTSQPDCGGSAVVVQVGGVWAIRFTPPEGFCGLCQFTYTIDDLGGLTSNVATVTVDVLAVNEPPVAADDSGFSRNGAPVLIDVCANDSDPDEATGCGALLNCTDSGNNPIQLGPQPGCGTFSAVFNGGRWQVRYDPAPGFCGDCQITYRIADEAGLQSNLATITVDVTLLNNPPVAVDDKATTPEDTPVAIPLLANDSDPDTLPCGAPLDPDSVVITQGPDPSCGTVNPGPYPGGVVTFTPSPDFCGECTFTYRVCDSDGKEPLCDTAQVTVTVTAVNDCPIAADDYAETEVGVAVLIPVCDNDSDVDDQNSCGGGLDCTTVTVLTQPDCGGSATAMGDGTIRFEPPPGFVGICCFTYVVSDLATPPCASNVATVCVEVSEPPCLTENRRAPGSLLLYPEFDNREGVATMFTVTNVGDRDIQVEFVYRREGDCLEFNRKEDLTANDTLTLITNYHNPNQDRGFAYAFAQCPESNKAVTYDRLIGQLLVVDGLDSFSYAINTVSFKGGATATNDAECTSLPLTDVNGNHRRDLDGIEYAMAPDAIRIPRFLGQTSTLSSELILISLSGGPYFTTTLDFLIYNDNEEVFSTEHQFSCWERVPLIEISELFNADFLALATNHDPDEVLGARDIETGWMKIDGDIATSSSTTIYDPAFYAVLVEMVAPDHFVADLPFEQCTQGNGILLPNGTLGL